MPKSQTSKTGRKIGRGLRKPSSQRYVSKNRRAVNKNRRVLKSSHGKWTYKALLEHQGKLSKPQERNA